MDVTPVVEGGRYPVKAAVGEPLPVSALIFREGHDELNADLVVTDPTGTRRPAVRMHRDAEKPDLWHGSFTPDEMGAWTFAVESWSDPVATWRHNSEIKIPAGIDVELMFTEGVLLLERLAKALPKRSPGRRTVADAVKAVTDTTRPDPVRYAAAVSPAIDELLAETPLRDLVTTEGPYPFFADRERALFSAWYEFFPRSEGAYVDETTGKIVPGTLRTAARRLDAVAEMGFDIIYLPPIHPIGRLNRKGPNNTLTPGPRRPGLAVGDRLGRGRPRRDPPRARHVRGPRRVRRPGPRARPRGRARPGAPGGPGPPVGQQAPGVVHHPRRRQHRLRREPAEEVPGHLPGQLRQRPRGHLRRGAAHRPAVDVARRPGVPRGQPAHQAGAVLGVADGPGPRDRPRRAVPGRGVHQARDDARRSARSASTSPTATSPGATRSGRSRSTSRRSPTTPATCSARASG